MSANCPLHISQFGEIYYLIGKINFGGSLHLDVRKFEGVNIKSEIYSFIHLWDSTSAYMSQDICCTFHTDIVNCQYVVKA